MSNARSIAGDAPRALLLLGEALLIIDLLGRPDIAARLQEVIESLREAIGG